MILVFIILSLVAAAFFAQYNFWRLVKNYSLPRILMYHNTSNEVSSGMNISPELLEKQIQYLIKKKYTFLKISDLLGSTNIARHVVLTFDDGFVGNHGGGDIEAMRDYFHKTYGWAKCDSEPIYKLTLYWISKGHLNET